MNNYKILEYKQSIKFDIYKNLFTEEDKKRIEKLIKATGEQVLTDSLKSRLVGIDLGKDFSDSKTAFLISTLIASKYSYKNIGAIKFLMDVVLDDNFSAENNEIGLLALKALIPIIPYNNLHDCIQKIITYADNDLQIGLLIQLRDICRIALNRSIFVSNSFAETMDAFQELVVLKGVNSIQDYSKAMFVSNHLKEFDDSLRVIFSSNRIDDIRTIINDIMQVSSAILRYNVLNSDALTIVLTDDEMLEYSTIIQVISGSINDSEIHNIVYKNCKDEKLYRIIQAYYRCIKFLKNINAKDKGNKRDAIESINNLIDLIGFEYKNNDSASRIMMSCILSIKENYTRNIIEALLSEKSDVIEYYIKTQMVLYWFSLNDKKYELIKQYLFSFTFATLDPLEKQLRKIEKMLSIWGNSDKIKDLLKVIPSSESDKEYAYYTSYETFSLMFPFKCDKDEDRKDECGKLSVMNVGYMNDPNEGIILFNYLLGKNSLYSSQKPIRKILSSQFVFIKCFTSMIDYLPMWKMYGEYGDNKQCVCLVIDLKELSNVPLYHVCYIDKNDDTNPVRESSNTSIDFKTVNESIKKIKKICVSICTKKELAFIEYFLEPLKYLFKDVSYSYEQEIRLVHIFDEYKKVIRNTKHNPPKLYVPSETPIQIKEVILGPRFERVSEYSPFLQEQLEKMAKATKKNVPRITLSSIDYR